MDIIDTSKRLFIRLWSLSCIDERKDRWYKEKIEFYESDILLSARFGFKGITDWQEEIILITHFHRTWLKILIISTNDYILRERAQKKKEKRKERENSCTEIEDYIEIFFFFFFYFRYIIVRLEKAKTTKSFELFISIRDKEIPTSSKRQENLNNDVRPFVKKKFENEGSSRKIIEDKRRRYEESKL